MQGRNQRSVASSVSQSAQSVKPLGSYLVEAGLITPAQVDVALNDQQLMMDMRFGEVLVARGWIKQQTLDFLMQKVVEPEQTAARQPTHPTHPTHPTQPTTASSHPDLPQARLVQPESANADATLYLEIVPPPFTRSPASSAPSTPPSAYDTTEVFVDRSELLNDRKSLPSVSSSEDDGVNWVG